MNLTKDIKNLVTGFLLSLNSADREILFSEFSKIPENNTSITNPVYSRNDFLRAIQKGQLTEQQLKWFYSHLDAMDKFHRNGGAMGLTEDSKPKIDDVEPGFITEHIFQNREIQGSMDKEPINTLTVLRDENRHGYYKIEDYCQEVYVKKNSNGQMIAEFYCTDYKNNGNNLQEQAFKEINDPYNLFNFVNVKAFNLVRSTATRNAINHPYKVLEFHNIKKLPTGFVVKFKISELSNIL